MTIVSRKMYENGIRRKSGLRQRALQPDVEDIVRDEHADVGNP